MNVWEWWNGNARVAEEMVVEKVAEKAWERRFEKRVVAAIIISYMARK